jgi:hypothetical protein
MITVRLKCTDLTDPEAALVKAGVPPMAIRSGIVRQWFEPKTDEWVYEYIPREETIK